MRRPPALAVLLLVLLALLPGRAQAQAPSPFATVALVAEPDDAGRWRAVDPAAAAVRVRDGVETPIAAGMALAVGDTLRADLARIEVRYHTGERLNLTEGTTLTLTEDRSVLQELGEVYYRVRGAFRVQYGTVETVVEGTRFVVLGAQGGAAVRVRVDEGRVRVSNSEGDAPVARGESIDMPLAGPAATAPVSARPTPRDVARTFPLGRPRLVLGALATGGALVQTGEVPADISLLRGSYGLRLSAGLGIARMLRLQVDSTVHGAGRQGIQLPQDLSLAITLPGVAFGGGPSFTIENRTKICDARYRALHIGGAGWVRGSLPMGRRLALAAELRGGYAGGVHVGGAAGVEVSL